MEPDTPIRVVIFGYWLDRVDLIIFTVDNCLNAVINVTHGQLISHSERVLEMSVKFPE